MSSLCYEIDDIIEGIIGDFLKRFLFSIFISNPSKKEQDTSEFEVSLKIMWVFSPLKKFHSSSRTLLQGFPSYA